MSKDRNPGATPDTAPLYNRREALVRLTLETAGAVYILRDVLRGRPSQETRRSEPRSERIYQNGELIEHPLSPRVNGWGITLDLDNILLKRTTEEKDVRYQLSLRSLTPIRDTVTTQLNAHTPSKYDYDDGITPDVYGKERSPLQELEEYTVARSGTSEERGIYMGVLPLTPRDLALLEIVKTRGNEPPEVSTFTFRLDTPTFVQEQYGTSLFSEVPLPQDTVRQLIRVNDSHPITFNSKIHILNSGRYPKGLNPFTEKAGFLLESGFFERPENPQQGEIALFHALSYSAIKDFKKRFADYEDNSNKAVPAFHTVQTESVTFNDEIKRGIPNRFKDEKGFHLSTEAKQSPFARLFDDTYYTAQEGYTVVRPHFPYPQEGDLLDTEVLFASALTTFKYHPDAFLANYARLNPSQQRTARNFAIAALTFVDILRESEHKANLTEFEHIKAAFKRHHR